MNFRRKTRNNKEKNISNKKINGFEISIKDFKAESEEEIDNLLVDFEEFQEYLNEDFIPFEGTGLISNDGKVLENYIFWAGLKNKRDKAKLKEIINHFLELKKFENFKVNFVKNIE